MSNKPDGYKIFISYSRKDKDIVLPFSAKLEDIFGIKCWIDLQGIAHTEDFTEKIISAIDSCEIFLFMSSKNSMSSEFVKKEVSYALKNGKRIAPVMIDEQPFTNYFQFTLGHLNCINYNDEKDIKKFIADLYSWLKIDNLQSILARCNFVFPLKELSQDAFNEIVSEFKIRNNENNAVCAIDNDDLNLLYDYKHIKYSIINLDMIEDDNALFLIKRVLSEHAKHYSLVMVSLIGDIEKIKYNEIRDFLTNFSPNSTLIWDIKNSYLRREIIILLGR